MPDKRILTKTEIIAVFTIAFVRLGLYGFSYYPVMDDWIQYMVYPLFSDPLRNVFFRIGLFATRPLAGLADIFVWGQSPLRLSFILITFFHALSCLLLISVARRLRLSLGIGFILIYLLLPLNTEATIWLSASSRLVMPLFFTAISLYLLVDYKKSLFFFWLIQLISLFFYEQTALLSAALCLLIAFYLKRKKALFIVIANFFIFTLYYAIFSSMGAFGGRSLATVPTMEGLTTLFEELSDGFLFSHIPLYTNGLGRGLAALNENGWYYLFYIGAIVIVFIISSKRNRPVARVENITYFICERAENKIRYKGFIKLIVGLILLILPFLPFVVLNQHLSFRNFFPSLLGLGLIFDCILEKLPFKRLIATGLAAIFLLVSFSELTDYKNVSLADREFVLSIKDEALKPDFIVRRKATLVPINVLYGQHIHSVTESDWALTGCMRALTKNPQFPTIKVE